MGGWGIVGLVSGGMGFWGNGVWVGWVMGNMAVDGCVGLRVFLVLGRALGYLYSLGRLELIVWSGVIACICYCY